MFPIFKNCIIIGYRFCNIVFTINAILRIAHRIAIAARLRGDETTTMASCTGIDLLYLVNLFNITAINAQIGCVT